MHNQFTTTHWGAVEVCVKNGKIARATGFSEDPNPPGIASAIPEAVYHGTRVGYPSIRKAWLNNKGSRHTAAAPRIADRSEFITLPWDEALDIAAQELDRVRHEYGNEAVFGGSYGWASAGRFHHALSQVHRFLNCIGGYVSSVASYSTAAAQAIIPHVFGMHFLKLMWQHQNAWTTIADHTELLLMFGGINPKNSQVSMGGVSRHETLGWFTEFAARGIRRINVSPQRTDAPDGAHWWPIVPGTDTALMLALAHELVINNQVDEKFISTCTVGYEQFKPYLLGQTDAQPKSAQWASSICQIAVADIKSLAAEMARKRTLITVSWSLQRAENGEQPIWMAAVLAAMLGQIGLPGGGIGYGYGAIGGIGVSVKRLDGLALPQGENAVQTSIPVARFADMLLNPGEAYRFNGQTLYYPDIRLVYWCGGNPYHHHQDLTRLDIAWQRPQTIIIHEPWWTASALRADIVFPATTSFEREDIGKAQGDSYLYHMPKIIEPVQDSRDDYEIFSALAQRLNAFDQFTEGRTSEQWTEHLYREFRHKHAGDNLPTWSELKRVNYIDLPIRDPSFAPGAFVDFRNNPETCPLATPSGKIEIFSSVVAGFDDPHCPGHPVWVAAREFLGSAWQKRYPLHLVSPQPDDKLHSQLECALADQNGGRPVSIKINSHDAAVRGIETNQRVRVENERGTCLAIAMVSEDIRSGVVAMPTGAWYQLNAAGVEVNGNPNALTRDTGTSTIGQGCSAHSCLVEVLRHEGNLY